jgi:hypothetical protein
VPLATATIGLGLPRSTADATTVAAARLVSSATKELCVSASTVSKIVRYAAVFVESNVAVQGEGIAGVSIEQPLPISKLAELTKVAMANYFYRLGVSQWPSQERPG